MFSFFTASMASKAPSTSSELENNERQSESSSPSPTSRTSIDEEDRIDEPLTTDTELNRTIGLSFRNSLLKYESEAFEMIDQWQTSTDLSFKEEIETLRHQLAAAEDAKREFEKQYKNLLGKVSGIRDALGDRLKTNAVRTILVRCCNFTDLVAEMKSNDRIANNIFRRKYLVKRIQ